MQIWVEEGLRNVMIYKRGNLRKNRWDTVCRRHPDWKDKEDTPQMGTLG